MAAPIVQIEGLNELRRDMAKIDKEAMARAMVEAGLKVSVPAAGAIAAALPRGRTGALSGSVRSAKIRTGGAVRMGSRGVPYAGPVDFGGYPGARPFLPDGRYMFPTARRYAAENNVVGQYTAAIQAAIDAYQWEHP